MNPNPVIGVLYHWLGGLASGSFYVPYRGVKRWAWETFWLAGGFFSWIIAPWFFALLMTRDLLPVLRETPGTVIFWTFFFGLLWGIGGLTFGLTMRYLGLSLGMAVVLGLCAAFGTLIPPIFRGEFMTQVVGTSSGRIILLGIFVCLLGIAAAGLAGIYKERAMSPEQQKETIKEFDLKKGVGVAVLSGVMSACFAYGLAAGDPIKALTIKHGTPDLWQGLPVLVVVLLGGFTTNFIWCVILNVRNKTGYQYFTSISREPDEQDHDEIIIETAVDAPSREVVEHMPSAQAAGAVLSGASRCARFAKGRRGASSDAGQLFVLRAGRHYLVFPVLLLLDGRNPDGQVQIFQLDAAHGQHHHLQQPVGHRIERMEGRGSAGGPAAGSGAPAAGGIDGDRRLRKLCRPVTLGF